MGVWMRLWGVSCVWVREYVAVGIGCVCVSERARITRCAVQQVLRSGGVAKRVPAVGQYWWGRVRQHIHEAGMWESSIEPVCMLCVLYGCMDVIVGVVCVNCYGRGSCNTLSGVCSCDARVCGCGCRSCVRMCCLLYTSPSPRD